MNDRNLAKALVKQQQQQQQQGVLKLTAEPVMGGPPTVYQSVVTVRGGIRDILGEPATRGGAPNHPPRSQNMGHAPTHLTSKAMGGGGSRMANTIAAPQVVMPAAVMDPAKMNAKPQRASSAHQHVPSQPRRQLSHKMDAPPLTIQGPSGGSFTGGCLPIFKDASQSSIASVQHQLSMLAEANKQVAARLDYMRNRKQQEDLQKTRADSNQRRSPASPHTNTPPPPIQFKPQAAQTPPPQFGFQISPPQFTAQTPPPQFTQTPPMQFTTPTPPPQFGPHTMQPHNRRTIQPTTPLVHPMAGSNPPNTSGINEAQARFLEDQFAILAGRRVVNERTGNMEVPPTGFAPRDVKLGTASPGLPRRPSMPKSQVHRDASHGRFDKKKPCFPSSPSMHPARGSAYHPEPQRRETQEFREDRTEYSETTKPRRPRRDTSKARSDRRRDHQPSANLMVKQPQYRSGPQYDFFPVEEPMKNPHIMAYDDDELYSERDVTGALDASYMFPDFGKRYNNGMVSYYDGPKGKKKNGVCC
eukprot:GHVO01018556.1.p1 GENE.GHVO01018556.1~~GHVO01018556.1.p1  ORF type:complete len:598 (-),score=88.76 GHVO01018556.1:1336-2919(-)